MGRKPNPLILEFFERGAKLDDNSNRYHHRCKSCGEDFPKGRIDSLTNHLTKKCPAISEADRINACLALHGINGGSNHVRYDGLLHTGPNPGPLPGPSLGPSLDPSLEQSETQTQTQTQAQSQSQSQSQLQSQSQTPNPDHSWTALETLAEVSRQIEANEKHDDHIPIMQDSTTEANQTTLATPEVPAPAVSVPAAPVPASFGAFELHEQYTLENPPANCNDHSQHKDKGIDALVSSQESLPVSQTEASTVLQTPLTATERLVLFFQTRNQEKVTQSALSVAAAATARLNSSLLNTQPPSNEAVAEPTPHTQSTEMLIEYPPSPETSLAPGRKTESATPWDGMTYMAEDIHAPAIVNDHGLRLPPTLSKGGHRMDTSNGFPGARHRHSRAKFDHDRRKEVQRVRRVGACIRCRILRKTCSPGTPCNTCKKVLSPRIWRTGCVRTNLSEKIELYSASVISVMVQKRINRYKSTYNLQSIGIVVEASHFPETDHKAVFQILQGTPKEEEGVVINDPGPILLLDNNKEDIPAKIEVYVRQALPELISREPSHYIRVTLEAAVDVAQETNNDLLNRAIELWGIVEMMDRERQWTILAKSPKEGVDDQWIKDETDTEAYTTICMQLTAAGERKASAASRDLLSLIQRDLQDGKTKLGFPMFLTVMLFLNCVEKTTWVFKAWDEENLRPKWPLEKPPSTYTNQGQELMEILRMLLVIRHILPKVVSTGPSAPLIVDERDPTIRSYFQRLSITPNYLQTRLQNNFQPTDSRSLEFLFCSALLLN
ncbi:hypothetical protein GGR54DRAFT_89836 [Hypoxylon sp. NC1633]|nr:hypothetical protein GGR54DRAFT_89836 [Hypoxylon sp. NC1633]